MKIVLPQIGDDIMDSITIPGTQLSVAATGQVSLTLQQYTLMEVRIKSI